MGCPGGCWEGHQGDHWGGHVLEPSKEAQQAALHYPHGHWIKLLLKPVEENQEDNQEDDQEQNDAAL